jgi:hypothetical protein
MRPAKGKIGVLIEAHFDETEYHRFGEFFPANGYAVEYLCGAGSGPPSAAPAPRGSRPGGSGWT